MLTHEMFFTKKKTLGNETVDLQRVSIYVVRCILLEIHSYELQGKRPIMKTNITQTLPVTYRVI